MRLISLALLSLAVAACASGTGPDAARRFTTFDTVTTADFRQYDRVYLERPTAAQEVLDRLDLQRLSTRSNQERPLGERDIEQALERLDEDLRRELGTVVTLVDEPGPGILTIEPVLIDLNANRPTMAELSAEPGLSFQSIAAGDAAVTYTFSEDGMTLATARDRNIDNTLAQARPIVGIWDTSNRFFDLTSRRVRALLEG
jgi:hypothetical protein